MYGVLRTAAISCARAPAPVHTPLTTTSIFCVASRDAPISLQAAMHDASCAACRGTVLYGTYLVLQELTCSAFVALVTQ